MHARAEQDLNRTAFSATTHCLTGCAIGEVLGMAIATAAGWGNLVSIVLAIVLAFFFGYLLTLWPVLRAGLSVRQATGVALAADTVSIAIMEAVDNGFVLVVPGALNAGLGDAKFWWSRQSPRRHRSDQRRRPPHTTTPARLGLLATTPTGGHRDGLVARAPRSRR